MEENKEEKIIESTQEEQVEVRAEESVVEQPKQKKNYREYNKLVIDSMSELIDRKLEGCKTGLPMILTIVTSAIAFLFATKFKDKELFDVAIVALVLLLGTFISLLIASMPLSGNIQLDSYLFNWTPRRRFNPSDCSTYLKMDNDEFTKSLSEYLDTDFIEEEKQKVKCLKNKINEYNFKKAWLNIAYMVLIVGAIMVIVLLFVALSIGMGEL